MGGATRIAGIAAVLAILACAAAAGAADPDPQLRQAAALAAKKETQPRAVEIYRVAVANDPSAYGPRLQLARVLSWTGRNDESIAQYRLLLQYHPGDYEGRIGLAEVLSWSGRHEESSAQFESILQERPDDARAILGLARNRLWAGDHEGADEAYTRALALVGTFLASQDTYDDAIEIFRAALERDPTARDPRLRVAEVLSWQGKFDEALAEYEVLLEHQPDDVEALLGRAEVLSWSERYKEAETAFNAVLASDPTNLRAIRGLTRIYVWVGPNPPDDPYGRAMAFVNRFTENQKQFPLAIEVCRTVLALDQHAYAPRLKLAQILAWASRSDESVAEYDTLLAHYPGDLDARLGRAETLAWGGKLPESESAFKAILAEHPDNSRAAVGLARSYYWSGDLDRADDAYRRALELDDNPTTRSEWRETQKGAGLRVGGRFAMGGDNQGFNRQTIEGFAVYSWDRKTELGAQTSHELIRGNNGQGSDEGQGFVLSVGRRLVPGLDMRLSSGYRAWNDSPDSWMLRLEGSYAFDKATSLTGSVGHGDSLELLDSVQALRKGVTTTGGSLGISRGLGHGVALFSQGQLNSLSDGNFRASGFSSLSYSPWGPLSLDASYWVVHYADASASDLYWDPSLAWNAGLGAKLGSDLPFGFNASTELSGGLSYSRTSEPQGGRRVGVENLGPAWGLKGQLGWTHGPWSVLAMAGVFGSQRVGSYDGKWTSFRIERSF
jgi:tetratricopeptide (TPR) repeat protein